LIRISLIAKQKAKPVIDLQTLLRIKF